MDARTHVYKMSRLSNVLFRYIVDTIGVQRYLNREKQTDTINCFVRYFERGYLTVIDRFQTSILIG